MANTIERLMIRSIDRLYPERGWIPTVSAFGCRLKGRLDRATFDLRLLDLQNPNPLQLLRICYAYARYEVYESLQIESHAWAKIYYGDCYFIHLADADSYFYAIFFIRYFFRSICMTFRECKKYIALKLKGDKAPLTTIQLCLAAYYTNPTIEVAP